MECPSLFNTEIVKKDKQSVIFRASCKNTEECQVWLQEYSNVSRTNWIVLYELTTPERLILHKKWACQHSKKNKIKDSKRNINCEAKITIKIKKVNKNTMKNDPLLKRKVPLCCVIEVSLNHTHNTDVADSLKYLRISAPTKEQFISYFNDGLTPNQAMRFHTSKIMMEQDGKLKSANASINPCSNTVYPLYKQWSETNFGKINPLEKVKEKMEGYKEKGAHVALQEDGDTFAGIVITPTMRRAQNQQSSKEMIFLDSTASCDVTQVNITILHTVTKCGAIPIGVLLHSNQTEENYSMAFELFRSEFPLAFGGSEYPTVFMTDDSAAERNALNTVWPLSKQLLCKFHVVQAEWRWLLSNEKALDRQKLMKMFKKVMNADSEESLETALQEMETIKDKHLKFYNRFNKFFKRKEEWVMFYRLKLVTRNNNTNNYSEASIRVLKDIILERTKAFNIVALIDFTISVWEEYFTTRILNVAYNRCLANELFYNKLCAKVKNIDPTLVIKIDEDNFDIPSVGKNTTVYNVNVDVGICTCPNGRQGAFCKHQAWLHKNYGIALPNAPPVTAVDRYWLGVLALGNDCPPPNFFRDIRDTNDLIISTQPYDSSLVESSSRLEEPMQLEHQNRAIVLANNENDIFIDTDNNGESFKSAAQILKLELDRVIGLSEGEPNSTAMLDKLYKVMKSVKTPSVAMSTLVAMKIAVTSCKRRGGRIHTQPTAAARRRDGVSRGSRPIPMGRPSQQELARRGAKKRPRNINLAISQNVANAKSH